MTDFEKRVLKELRDVKQTVNLLCKRFETGTVWMSAEEVMKATGWSQRNLYRHSTSGKFTKRVSGGLKFKRSEINEYLEGQTRPSKKETLKKAA